jgi:hypothetical protein
MPILGYAGYIPFGLECAAIGNILENLFSAKNNYFVIPDEPKRDPESSQPDNFLDAGSSPA